MDEKASLDPRVTASLIKNKRTTLERIEKYISPIYFTDVNLYGKIYPFRKNVDLCHWKIPGSVGAWEEWKFDEIMKQKFSAVSIGDQFGPGWSTHWFKLTFQIPDEWDGKRVHLRWKSQSESMLWNSLGIPLQGLSSGTETQMRTDYCISPSWKKNSKVQTLFIEMAGNTMFGLGRNGQINPPNHDKMFTVEMAEICVFNNDLYSLMVDLNVLHDLAKLKPDDQRGVRALYTGNQIINEIIKGNVKSAQSLSSSYFAKKSGEMQNTISLIGNCHIDSAWLWPYSETKRKCARSWMSTIELMDSFPEMFFAASQAQQFAWVKEFYPAIYKKIKDKVSDGKFIPVGGTWVEMDGLIPSGESFMRQFLFGQKFFKEEFGIHCKEFWLPDTFGYAAQIPQICQQFNIDRFLTQKMSWSLVNKFPHHSFVWEGIDGSQILAHFPPGDGYELEISVKDILHSESNFADKGRSSTVALLYGYGDGGGGPTRDMLERAARLRDLDGLPKLKHMTPDQMFTQIESEKENLCKWVGELYLELHNGTYTSQAETKYFNRKCEFEAKNAEYLLSTVSVLKVMSKDEINRLKTTCDAAWKSVLLNQFHDVLPGSSIGLVYKDSKILYEEALKNFSHVSKMCQEALLKESEESSSICILNTNSWAVEKVFLVDEKTSSSKSTCQISRGGTHVAVKVEPLSFEAHFISPPSVLVDVCAENFEIENRFLRALISPYGQILKLIYKSGSDHKRNILADPDSHNNPKNRNPPRGNLLCIYDDIPLYWDAWDIMDYHLETRKILNCSENSSAISTTSIEESGPLIGRLSWEMHISANSYIKQSIELTATSKHLTFNNKVEWNERHKLLKVEFETSLLVREASYDTQFGYVTRPTHINTSWDSARYEVCGHKWADISEYGAGLAILNDCKYGWSAKGATICLSLLRAPKAPDENCDIGHHEFKYAAMPHAGSFQEAGVIEAAYEFNTPTPIFYKRECNTTWEKLQWLKLEGDGVILEACKPAEDDPSCIILRLYESYGRQTLARMCFPLDTKLSEAVDCDGLESPKKNYPYLSIMPSKSQKYVSTYFSPFQIKTLRLHFRDA